MKSLKCMSLFLILSLLAPTAPAGAQGGVRRDRRCLPPVDSSYLAGFHAQYSPQFLMSNPAHSRFTHCLEPPREVGGVTEHAFGSLVCFRFSMNGGKTWKDMRAQAQCLVRVRLVEEDPTNGVQFFDTEMLQLDIRGGNLPPGAMVRESPTQPSMGQTRIQRLEDGSFQIDSFFDIFTELSLDGGQNWLPAVQAGHVELTEADALREHTIKPDKVVGCQSTTGRLVLNAPAPPGGAKVDLVSDNGNVIVPASVLIPEGACHKTYRIKTKPVSTTQEAHITATYAGTSLTATMTVRPIGVRSLSLSTKRVRGGNVVTGKVTLECPAGPGDIVVKLSSNKPAVASVPASITIPAGQKTGTFEIQTHPVDVTTKVKITAMADNGTAAKSATLTVTP